MSGYLRMFNYNLERLFIMPAERITFEALFRIIYNLFDDFKLFKTVYIHGAGASLRLFAFILSLYFILFFFLRAVFFLRREYSQQVNCSGSCIFTGNMEG